MPPLIPPLIPPADLHEVTDVIVAIVAADFLLPWVTRALRDALHRQRCPRCRRQRWRR